MPREARLRIRMTTVRQVAAFLGRASTGTERETSISPPARHRCAVAPHPHLPCPGNCGAASPTCRYGGASLPSPPGGSPIATGRSPKTQQGRLAHANHPGCARRRRDVEAPALTLALLLFAKSSCASGTNPAARPAWHSTDAPPSSARTGLNSAARPRNRRGGRGRRRRRGSLDRRRRRRLLGAGCEHRCRGQHGNHRNLADQPLAGHYLHVSVHCQVPMASNRGAQYKTAVTVRLSNHWLHGQQRFRS